MRIIIITILFQFLNIAILVGQSPTFETTNYRDWYNDKDQKIIYFNYDLGVTGTSVDIKWKYLPLRTVSTTYELQIKEISGFGSNIVGTSSLPNISDVTELVFNNVVINKSGLYEVCLVENPGDAAELTFYEKKRYILCEEKIDYISDHLPNDTFRIHYAEQFFKFNDISLTSNDYITHLKLAIDNACKTLIRDWQLTNSISDSDKTIHIYLHPSKSVNIEPVSFFGNSMIAGIPTLKDDVKIQMDINPSSARCLNATLSGYSEKDIINNLFHHEFFHAIQFGFFNPTMLKLGDYWLLEGQAKFLETAYMQNFLLLNGTNLAYQPGSFNFTYDYYVKNFLSELDNTSYSYRSIHDMNVGYQFGIFWRFLYDHNWADTSVRNSSNPMKMLTQACINYSSHQNKPASLLNIKNDIMTPMLAHIHASENGIYKNFDEALVGFAKALYFCDTSWRTKSGNPVSRWADPNSNNFHQSMVAANGFNQQSTLLPDDIDSFTPQTFSIDKSYGIRFHRYKNNVGKEGEKVLVFNPDPDGDGVSATFNVMVYRIDTAKNKLIDEQEIDLSSGKKAYAPIKHKRREHLVVQVVRTDEHEGANNNYSIDWEELKVPIPNFTFSADPIDHCKIKLTDASQNVADYMEYKWSFGSSDKNPEYTFESAGKNKISLAIKVFEDTYYVEQEINVLPPYIKELKISSPRQTRPVVFSRKVTSEGLVKVNSDKYLENNEDITVSVETSLPLQSLQINVENQLSELLYTKLKTERSSSKYFQFTIPKDKVTEGFLTFSFEGTHGAEYGIISVEKVPQQPVTSDTLAVSYTNITGIDIYSVYNADGKSADASSLNIEWYIKSNSCSGANINNEGYFFNRSANNYILRFCDGSKVSLPTNKLVKHLFPLGYEKCNIEILDKDGKLLSDKSILFN